MESISALLQGPITQFFIVVIMMTAIVLMIRNLYQNQKENKPD